MEEHLNSKDLADPVDVATQLTVDLVESGIDFEEVVIRFASGTSYLVQTTVRGEEPSEWATVTI